MLRSTETKKLSITFDEKNEQTEAANQIQQQSNEQQQSGNSYNWPFGNYFGW